MSKEAALRAMREARYNERMGLSAKAPARAAKAAAPVAPRTGGAAKAVPAASAAAAEPAADALCGHRSMNGRTCTREQGHTAKNHRYS